MVWTNWTKSSNLPSHPAIVSYIQRSIRVHGHVDGFTQLEQSMVGSCGVLLRWIMWDLLMLWKKRSARFGGFPWHARKIKSTAACNANSRITFLSATLLALKLLPAMLSCTAGYASRECHEMLSHWFAGHL